MNHSSEIKNTNDLVDTFPISSDLKNALKESYPIFSKINCLIKDKYLKETAKDEQEFNIYFEEKTLKKFIENAKNNPDKITPKTIQKLLGPMTFLTANEVVLDLANQLPVETSVLIELKSHLIICKRLLDKEYENVY